MWGYQQFDPSSWSYQKFDENFEAINYLIPKFEFLNNLIQVEAKYNLIINLTYLLFVLKHWGNQQSGPRSRSYKEFNATGRCYQQFCQHFVAIYNLVQNLRLTFSFKKLKLPTIQWKKLKLQTMSSSNVVFDAALSSTESFQN